MISTWIDLFMLGNTWNVHVAGLLASSAHVNIKHNNTSCAQSPVTRLEHMCQSSAQGSRDPCVLSAGIPGRLPAGRRDSSFFCLCGLIHSGYDRAYVYIYSCRHDRAYVQA